MNNRYILGETTIVDRRIERPKFFMKLTYGNYNTMCVGECVTQVSVHLLVTCARRLSNTSTIWWNTVDSTAARSRSSVTLVTSPSVTPDPTANTSTTGTATVSSDLHHHHHRQHHQLLQQPDANLCHSSKEGILNGGHCNSTLL